MFSRILTIAGTDSGGDAGIAADLRAIEAHGMHGACVVTAVTAQNSAGVRAVHAIPGALVAAQTEAVLEGYDVRAIKTGMLPTGEVVDAIADVLTRRGAKNLVIDPVLVSTSGKPLVDEHAMRAIVDRLAPMCALITPNLAEAERLAGMHIDSIDGMIAAGEALRARGANAVLVKGGHATFAPATDVLVDAQGHTLLQGTFVIGVRTRGTGCMLASAIASLLGGGAEIADATRTAKDWVEGRIEVMRDWVLAQAQ